LIQTLTEKSVAIQNMRGQGLIQTLTEKSVAIQNMRGQGYFRAAKDDYGSKYISLLFYFCPDTCVSLVLLLA